MDPPPSTSWRPASTAPAWTPATGHLWRIDLHGEAQALGRWEASLSPDESARAERFTALRERRRFIVARGALRAILGDYLNVSPADLRFEYGPAGKPRLAGGSPAPRFNLSHCEDTALLAVAPDVEVGVDVERVRSRAAALDIAERYWTPEELTACRDFRSRLHVDPPQAANPSSKTTSETGPRPEKAPAAPGGAIEACWDATSSAPSAASLVHRPEGTTLPLFGGMNACQANRGVVQAFSSSALSTANDSAPTGTPVETTAVSGPRGAETWTDAAFDAFWTRIWTRKEAILKGLGGGMFLPMERISVWPPGSEPTWRGEDGVMRRLPWRLLEFQPSAQDRACVAWEGDDRKWMQLEFAPSD